jgi:excisionase family DNA binding protein
MDNFSWRLSQFIPGTFGHAVPASEASRNWIEYLGPNKYRHKLIDQRQTRILGHRAKFRLTEFSAKKDRERRWSVDCALKERQFMLLTVEEVARDHLKVSRATVYRLIRAGELKSSKVLGCTRISAQELERFEKMIGGVQ